MADTFANAHLRTAHHRSEHSQQLRILRALPQTTENLLDAAPFLHGRGDVHIPPQVVFLQHLHTQIFFSILLNQTNISLRYAQVNQGFQHHAISKKDLGTIFNKKGTTSLNPITY